MKEKKIREKGGGRKPKYNEKTTTVAFRVPISKVEEVKEIIKNKQTQWKLKTSTER